MSHLKQLPGNISRTHILCEKLICQFTTPFWCLGSSKKKDLLAGCIILMEEVLSEISDSLTRQVFANGHWRTHMLVVKSAFARVEAKRAKQRKKQDKDRI